MMFEPARTCSCIPSRAPGAAHTPYPTSHNLAPRSTTARSMVSTGSSTVPTAPIVADMLGAVPGAEASDKITFGAFVELQDRIICDEGMEEQIVAALAVFDVRLGGGRRGDVPRRSKLTVNTDPPHTHQIPCVLHGENLSVVHTHACIRSLPSSIRTLAPSVARSPTTTTAQTERVHPQGCLPQGAHADGRRQAVR